MQDGTRTGVSYSTSEQDLIEEFVDDCDVRGLAKASIRSYRSNLNTFSRYVQKKGGDLVSAGMRELKGFLSSIRGKGFAPNTILNYYCSLSSFYDFLVAENVISTNPVIPFRRRYLRNISRLREKKRGVPSRKLISVEEMGMLVNSIINSRDKAVLMVFAKTGVRRDELVNMDVNHVDWEEQSITLVPHPKRSNPIVFFDDECARVLKQWLRVRPQCAGYDCKALFVGSHGERLERSGVYNMITGHAEKVGIHDSTSKGTEHHFTPICCRHWFTTHLLRAGMPREYVKELRGDLRKEAVDLYNHIDRQELRRSYLAHVPQLGV